MVRSAKIYFQLITIILSVISCEKGSAQANNFSPYSFADKKTTEIDRHRLTPELKHSPRPDSLRHFGFGIDPFQAGFNTIAVFAEFFVGKHYSFKFNFEQGSNIPDSSIHNFIDPNSLSTSVYLKYKTFGGGLSFSYYPPARQKIKPMVGITINVGEYNFYNFDWDESSHDSLGRPLRGHFYLHDGLHVACMAHYGYYIPIYSGFFISPQICGGIKEDFSYLHRGTQPCFKFEFNLGWRF